MGSLVTIGVYGFSGASFIDALRAADVRVLIDVRQRRGVRGSEYSWANSQRLQAALAEAGIEYVHFKNLAPTTELRRLQYAEDDRLGVGKRSRVALAPAYVEGYTAQILDHVDLREVVERMPAAGAAALLCVERDAAACHRSLIAARLERRHGLKVSHLTPG